VRSVRPWLSLAGAALVWSGAGPAPAADMDYGASDAAVEIARRAMLVDTHIDVPDRLTEAWADVTVATEGGDFDYERARRGGLDIPFMSIYTPPESEAEGTSFELANRLIDQVEALAGRAPGKFALVHNPLQAEEAWKSGLIGLALGMENGSPIAGRLDNLAFFKRRGISYITLAHSLSNHLADSSYDRNRQWNGLSPFGREVVAEMNRLGIMIDVSHLTDEAFFQVLELSRAPVIASHSSARHFTPGWERNMSDGMIRALAGRGGLVMINFGSAFLTRAAQQWYERMDQARDAFVNGNGFDEHGPEAREFERQYREKDPLPYANLDDAVAHFQHVIGLVGIQHVGIGSDFDGVGDSLPVGLKDVSFYPNLVERLLRLNYPLRDIEAILGGNLMRVWREVEEQARQAAGS
jgi:membrane dipeptidase